jgi:hypothetical protein
MNSASMTFVERAAAAAKAAKAADNDSAGVGAT